MSAFARILQHLLFEVLRIRDFDVGDLPAVIDHRRQPRDSPE